MRSRLLTLAFAGLITISAGCATGVRVGGNHSGAGVGGYIGPVPEVVRESPGYPPPPAIPLPEPMPPAGGS